MPTGFVSIADNGNWQIDADVPTLALRRAGRVASQQYTNGSTTNSRPTRVAIQLNDGEILALSCTSHCALGAKEGNVAYVYVDAPAGQIVEYFIFAPGSASVSSSGMQTFDASGRITFDSGWRLFDVRHILFGHEAANLPGGRKYAFVHAMINVSIYYTRVVNGQPPNSFISNVRGTSFTGVSINGGSIRAASTTIDVAATAPRAGTGVGFYETYTNNVNPASIIIDVTNYL